MVDDEIIANALVAIGRYKLRNILRIVLCVGMICDFGVAPVIYGGFNVDIEADFSFVFYLTGRNGK